MQEATFRFYAELNDFLPAHRQGKSFTVPFDGRVSIKHLIEALGVPHTEVDLVLVNGSPVKFGHIMSEGDIVSVYPVFESIDVGQVSSLRPQPLRHTRFIADTHLGKLAKHLRMLGFDTTYRNDFSDEEIASLSSTENRIVLTRDRGLLKRNAVTHGYLVRESEPPLQLAEVVRRFDLTGAIDLFKHCLRCNGLLEPVPKEAILDRLQTKTKLYYDEFRRCRDCDRIFWKGSHYQHMRQFMDKVLGPGT